MYKIVEVTNRSLLKKFVNFPLTLYKDNPYYVPEFFSDEMKNLNPKKSVFMTDGTAMCKCFLCYKDEEIVARACGIISKLYNEKTNSKRIRLSRFDSIDDEEAAKLVITAVEDWGKSLGMDTIHGPLDFTDMGREGMLIEGFDYISTYETQYNFPYYKNLIEKLGYQKEVDWLGYLVQVPSTPDSRNQRMSELVKKRIKVHELEVKSTKWLIKNYYDQIFDLIDETYGSLYGTIPITENVRKNLLSQFKLILDKDFVSLLVDENEKLVGFGLALPSIAKAVQKCKGKLFPTGWARVLHSIHHVEMIDLSLIGIKKEYRDTGIIALMYHYLLNNFIKRKVKIADTNVQLEENIKSIRLMDIYSPKFKCRRRCYVKSLDGKPIKFHKAITKEHEQKEKVEDKNENKEEK